MRYFVAIPVLAMALVGCTETAPVGVDEILLSQAASQVDNSCRSVRYEFHGTGAFPSFTAVFDGDIEGTAEVEFDPASSEFTENSVRSQGTVIYHVTDSAVPELIDKTFVTELDAITFFTPNDQGLLPVRARERALAGVTEAHLGTRGTFDDRDGAPPFEVDLRYSGVICP